MRTLTRVRKCTIFKIFEFIKIKNNFIWESTLPKLKNKTLALKHKYGGLKCTYVTYTDLTSNLHRYHSTMLVCLKQLYNGSFHERKTKTLFYIKRHLVIMINFIPIKITN